MVFFGHIVVSIYGSLHMQCTADHCDPQTFESETSVFPRMGVEMVPAAAAG